MVNIHHRIRRRRKKKRKTLIASSVAQLYLFQTLQFIYLAAYLAV